jgi:carboxypeptidase family protein
LRRSSVWLLLVLLLLAGPVLWLLFAPGELPPLPVLKSPLRETARAPTAPARRRVPEDKPPPAPVMPPTPPSKVAAPPPQPEPPQRRPQPTAVLSVVLEGLVVEVAAADTHVEVTTQRDGRSRSAASKDDLQPGLDVRRLAVNAGKGASFELDVAELLGDDRRREATVWIDRAGYLPVQSTVRIDRAEGGLLRVRLIPAGFAVGRVEDDERRPLAGAEVSVFVARGEEWEFVDSVETDEQGAYRVRLVRGATNRVVGAADGLLPWYQDLTGLAQGDSPLPVFVLRRGLAITGTVRFADGTRPDGTAFATRVASSPVLFTRTRRFSFQDGTLENCPAIGEIVEGDLEVGGILPGEVDVDISVPGVSSALCLSLRQRVTPPFHGVSFVIDGGALDVVVTADGRPVEGATIVLANDADSATAWTGADGKARLVGVPNRSYFLEIRVKGRKPSTSKVVAPAAGSARRVDVRW